MKSTRIDVEFPKIEKIVCCLQIVQIILYHLGKYCLKAAKKKGLNDLNVKVMKDSWGSSCSTSLWGSRG